MVRIEGQRVVGEQCIHGEHMSSVSQCGLSTTIAVGEVCGSML